MTFVHAEVSTRDLDEAAAGMRARYGTVAIRSNGLDYRCNTTGDDRFLLISTNSVGVFTCAAEIRDVVISTSSPGFAWESRGDRRVLNSSPTLFQRGDRLTAEVEDVRTDSIVLRHDRLQHTARLLYGEDDLDLKFDPAPLDEARLRVWNDVVAKVWSNRDSLGSSTIRASVYWALAITVLDTFDLQGDRARRVASARSLQRVFVRARGYIDEHLAEAIDVDDVLVASGATATELDRAFRALTPEQLSVSTYIRRERLEKAHEDLLQSDPLAGDTVRAVAERWGFAHAGAFARWYRERYGVSPRTTLWQ